MPDTTIRSNPRDAVLAALDALARAGLAPEPARLAVLYAYFSGGDPLLRSRLDAAWAGGGTPSAALLDELHAVFVAGRPAKDPGPRLEAAAADLLELTGRAGGQVASFERLLGDATGRLGALDEPDLRDFAAGLLALTRHLAVQTAQVSLRLGETEMRLAELRRELGETHRAALTDALTGLGNRRAFERDLADLLRDRRRSARPLALVLLDVDHFKQVNDTWGHQVGDAVLRAVAARLRDALRAEDRPARYGGEEFAVLLPDMTAEAALRVCERVRCAMADRAFVLRSSGERIGTVTVSGGVAVLIEGETAEAFVARADGALYAAKTAGRNRTMLAPVAG
ncbi:GGDEF domain-containing protein [Falsiroseomonas oryziterrae]|uniref:GGDEF domain-containing protein n=1 Tax=Falsiroseomonas oryziterrae TaxID=2911368 RepID=UPI001F337BF7|nr:GGDEF domain-containing protein [Roseomonas sp. NPKOSM-4]